MLSNTPLIQINFSYLKNYQKSQYIFDIIEIIL
jgi:hypothetical protein